MKFSLNSFLALVILLSGAVSHNALAQKRKPSSVDKCEKTAIDLAIKQFGRDYNYPHKKPIAVQQDPGLFKVVVPQGKGSDIGDITYHVDLNAGCSGGEASED